MYSRVRNEGRVPSLRKNTTSSIYYEMHLLSTEKERLELSKKNFRLKIKETDLMLGSIEEKLKKCQAALGRNSGYQGVEVDHEQKI